MSFIFLQLVQPEEIKEDRMGEFSASFQQQRLSHASVVLKALQKLVHVTILTVHEVNVVIASTLQIKGVATTVAPAGSGLA